MTHTLFIITYSSVVTGETVCIAITMAALHELKVEAAVMLNANAMPPNQEDICTVLGP